VELLKDETDFALLTAFTMAGALAAASVSMMPLATGRLSVAKGWPKAFLKASFASGARVQTLTGSN